MIGPVVALALPTMPDASAPIAAPGFAEILAIQSPPNAALPTLPEIPVAGEADLVAPPVDLTIPATVSMLSQIELPTVSVAIPIASALPDPEVAPPSPDVATIPVSAPPHEHRTVTDERDDDPIATVADTSPVPIPVWVAPQPPLQPAATIPERESVTAPVVEPSVAAPVHVVPQVDLDASTLKPEVMRALPSLPDTRRVTTIAAPRQANELAGSPIDVPVGRASTNPASVFAEATATTPGPTPPTAVPDRAPTVSFPQASTAPDPVRSLVSEGVPTPIATTSPAKVGRTAPDTRRVVAQPLPTERIARAPELSLPARPTQPKTDDLPRPVEAIAINVSAAPPALAEPDAPAPARPDPPAPTPRDPAPAFAIATPALGEVSAAVTARHDGIGERLHVHFAVERDATAALIAGHDGLDRALTAAGTRLDTVSVEVRSSTERSSGDAPRPDPRADPDRPRRPPPRSPQLRVAAPGRDRFA